MSSWHAYPQVWNLGHRAVKDLLLYPHVVEEKVDGSQFSFGVFEPEDHPNIEWTTVNPRTDVKTVHQYELRVRSKGAVMNPDAPEKMFTHAVETAKRLAPQLQIGWTYRGEYLAKPKHNSLAYDRIPAGHIILFDVSTGDGDWLSPQEKAKEAARLGLECVPVLGPPNPVGAGVGVTTLEGLRTILDNTTSVLGGQLIEGVVIKPLVPLFGIDKKTLMGKYVSERFKEVHRASWKSENPTTGDIIARIAESVSTPARWHKAIQHLRETGTLEDSPRDIGALMKEIPADIEKECEEEIKQRLYDYAWPHIRRAATRGFPEFYKNELLRRQFEQPTNVAITIDRSIPIITTISSMDTLGT